MIFIGTICIGACLGQESVRIHGASLLSPKLHCIGLLLLWKASCDDMRILFK
jgi:hypothetical protein